MAESNALAAVSEQAALEHILRHHAGADGWIALSRKMPDGSFQQKHYQLDELIEVLPEWVREAATDTYFSQNTFSRKSRRIENLKQLRSLYVDLDCYLLNFDPAWVIGNLELNLFKTRVPEPNLIIMSGRGLVLVWLIEPVPFDGLPLWQTVERYLFNEVQSFGGDVRATDAARIFRVAGTINSKNGADVAVHYRHDFRYSLAEIQTEYLPELTPSPRRDPGKRRKVSKTAQLFSTYRLYHDRLMDLRRLVELRKFDVEGHREIMCFLYRYWLCCFLDDQEEALRQTLEFNNEFLAPLPESEVITATVSAENAYFSDEKEYRYSNKRLIEVLGINEDEERRLHTIIGAVEKRRRNTEAKRKARDSVTRDKYLTEQHERSEGQLRRLQEALEQYPNAKQRELAKMLGVSDRYIRGLLSKLQSQKSGTGCPYVL